MSDTTSPTSPGPVPQAPRLPDLPPVIFSSLQVIERALSETPLTRAKFAEVESAMNNVIQYCINATQTERNLRGPAPFVTEQEVKDQEPARTNDTELVRPVRK